MMKNIIIIFALGFLSGQLMAQPINRLIFAKINGNYPLWDGKTVKTMGFTYTLNAPIDIPSPTLVFNEGDTVQLRLWNKSQGAPHTIHLHGLDVDQQNDGVPHLSFEVEHDSSGYYNFVAPHAGTYIYHCHVVSTLHVQAGMYGMIIIRPSDGSMKTWNNGYAYDSERAWLTSEVDSVWHHDTLINHPHDTSQMLHHVPEEYLPQYYLINGKAEQQLSDTSIAIYGSANEVIYLRVANIGNYGNRLVFPAALHARMIASDGRILPNEEISDTLLLFPGERYGILLEPTTEFMDSVKMEYFDLNNQQIANTQQIPVGIAGFFSTNKLSLEELDCQVFPNPTKDYLDVQMNLNQAETLTAKWFSLDGKLLLTIDKATHVGQNNFRFDTPDLGAGVYLLHLQTATGYSVQKIKIL